MFMIIYLKINCLSLQIKYYNILNNNLVENNKITIFNNKQRN